MSNPITCAQLRSRIATAISTNVPELHESVYLTETLLDGKGSTGEFFMVETGSTNFGLDPKGRLKTMDTQGPRVSTSVRVRLFLRIRPDAQSTDVDSALETERTVLDAISVTDWTGSMPMVLSGVDREFIADGTFLQITITGEVHHVYTTEGEADEVVGYTLGPGVEANELDVVNPILGSGVYLSLDNDIDYKPYAPHADALGVNGSNEVQINLGSGVEIEPGGDVVPSLGAATAISNGEVVPVLGDAVEVVSGAVEAILGQGVQLDLVDNEVDFYPYPDHATALSINGSNQVQIDLGSATQIVGGEVVPVLGEATQIVSGEVVPILGDAVEIDNEIVVAVYESGLSVSGGSVVLNRTPHVVDLTAPKGVLNPSGLTYSVVSAGSGNYTVQLTGNNAVTDGIAEGVTLRFDLKDPAGNTAAITTGDWIVMARVTIVSASAGNSLLCMTGVKTQPTSSSAGTLAIWGFSTGTVAILRSLATSVGINATATATGLKSIEGTIAPSLINSGSYRLGSASITCLDSSGVYISDVQSATSLDATPGTPELVVFLGYDAANLLTTSATIKVEQICYKIGA